MLESCCRKWINCCSISEKNRYFWKWIFGGSRFNKQEYRLEHYEKAQL